ncbi:MAG: arginine--tRNA ligase [Deltaproteobacteria bacterium]|nr:arginine--tRNA ligase [Deltaproteobacteria bacterium]
MKAPRQIVEEIVRKAVARGIERGAFPAAAATVGFGVDLPKKAEHGDLATNAAFPLAKLLGQNPMEAAEKLRALALDEAGMDGHIESVTVARPGFVNFVFSEQFRSDGLREIFARGSGFGRTDEGRGARANVEFVSANPTGPLHVGHGRGAVVGDVVASVLSACGYTVSREYYVNDQGAQIRNLGASLKERIKEAAGEPFEIPADGYHGEYVRELAAELVAQKGGAAGAMAVEELSGWGSARLLEAIGRDLESFGIKFDVWFRESELHSRGAIKVLVEGLKSRGLAFDDPTGAVMLGAEAGREFGDDKDRVLVKSNGDATYFASDVAYHEDKLKRGFSRLINVWGADHHGYIPRVRAGIKTTGRDPAVLDVILVQMVNVLRHGKPVAMSKRSGSFVTLREVLSEVGRDAARVVFCMRRPDAQLDFDLEIVKRRTLDNPVFYMQYGHARICSILRKAAAMGLTPPAYDSGLVPKLALPEEREIIKRLMFYPEALLLCARTLEPHHLVFYINETIGEFHGYYTKYKNTARVISEDTQLTAARLMLCGAVRTVLANAMGVLGVEAPERMDSMPGDDAGEEARDEAKEED